MEIIIVVIAGSIVCALIGYRVGFIDGMAKSAKLTEQRLQEFEKWLDED